MNCPLPGAASQTNVLIAKVSTYLLSGAPPTVSAISSTNTTWTSLGTFTNGTNNARITVYCGVFTGTPGTPSVSITLSATVTQAITKVQEWSGPPNCTPDGTMQTNGGSTAAETAPNITTTVQAAELLISGCANNGQFASAGPGGSYTEDTSFGNIGSDFYIQGAWLVTSSSGSQPGAAWTLNGPTPWSCVTVALP